MTKIFTVCAALPIAACAVDPINDLGELDLEGELAAPRTFDIDGADSAVRAVAAALRQDSENEIDFEVVSGGLALQASDGDLSLTAVQVVLADVTIPDTVLPPSGLVITDMLVTLDSQATAAAEWTADGRRADVSLDVDLTVKWAMLRDGARHPLADVRVRDLGLHLDVTRDGDNLDVSVAADQTGAFWSWAETFELRDLEMSLFGSF